LLEETEEPEPPGRAAVTLATFTIEVPGSVEAFDTALNKEGPTRERMPKRTTSLGASGSAWFPTVRP
jgi:hypothetical protein